MNEHWQKKFYSVKCLSGTHSRDISYYAQVEFFSFSNILFLPSQSTLFSPIEKKKNEINVILLAYVNTCAKYAHALQ